MRPLDWTLLASFLLFVAAYGVWKTRGKKDINGYFMADRSARWPTIVISIMATQASAITFLSTPGQAYVDGMRFVQFYFGLPIAMVILSAVAVPIYHRLKIFTAYEYLEQRFDLKNRILGSALFLIQRGLAAGFTILAPSLILSVLLGWDFRLTALMTGGLVIIYTTAGGSKAVQKTHLLQMGIVTAGMAAALFMVIHRLPADVSFMDAVRTAGKLGKLNIVSFGFNLSDRYNVWSGLIGGAFLALSYFGTDQTQVQRYLSGQSVAQIRLGLLANGIFKIPMQFFILFIGAMIFVFYQFVTPPLFFNPMQTARVKAGPAGPAYQKLESDYERLQIEKRTSLRAALGAMKTGAKPDEERALAELRRTREAEQAVRGEAVRIIGQGAARADTNDTNFIFLSFVLKYLPAGLVGLILAAILSASMSASAAELNALASVTVIDIYKRLGRRPGSRKNDILVSKLATIFWGFYAIAFALLAGHIGSLIEAVNILGSLFYGTILGIFLVAFFFKKIGGHATFAAALAAEAAILACYAFTKIPYLWFNVIGCLILIGVASVLNPLFKNRRRTAGAA
jgi:solute:Na+ symporter, SSS family